jgi:hypothetical protein
MFGDLNGLVVLYYIVGLSLCIILTLINYVAFAKRQSFIEENGLWRKFDRKFGVKTRTIVSFSSVASILTVSLILSTINANFAVVLGTIVGFLLLNVILDANTFRANADVKCGVCEHEAQMHTYCSECESGKKPRMNPLSDIAFALRAIKKELT